MTHPTTFAILFVSTMALFPWIILAIVLWVIREGRR